MKRPESAQPLLASFAQNQQVKIAGGIYDFAKGKIALVDRNIKRAFDDFRPVNFSIPACFEDHMTLSADKPGWSLSARSAAANPLGF
ncbi:MAG: hypothetical protein WCA96_09000 [Methylocella sp.]